MNDQEAMAEHLKMILGIIDRMAQTSFILKGWAITIISAILGFSIGTSNGPFGFFALFPCLIFWGLDSYYLWQERLFRSLYVQVRSGSKDIPSFSMDTNPCKKLNQSWLRTMISRTEFPLYAGIIVITLIIGSLN